MNFHKPKTPMQTSNQIKKGMFPIPRGPLLLSPALFECEREASPSDQWDCQKLSHQCPEGSPRSQENKVCGAGRPHSQPVRPSARAQTEDLPRAQVWPRAEEDLLVTCGVPSPQGPPQHSDLSCVFIKCTSHLQIHLGWENSIGES